MGDRIDDESLAGAWLAAINLRRQLAATAASIAETEDWVAETLDRLARVRPHDARRLQARAERARLFAARERAQAAVYNSGADALRQAAKMPADRPRSAAAEGSRGEAGDQPGRGAGRAAGDLGQPPPGQAPISRHRRA